MIRIGNPADCCGCTACASICQHGAITMLPDSLGFLYPQINDSKCIDCGLCNQVCQFNENYDHSLNLTTPLAYAVRHKHVEEVMQSRSGAAFVALTDYVLKLGGVVYGAGYEDHFRVVHKRAVTKEERDEFRGSKYVQSDLVNIFLLIKEDLKKGLLVLFSGTPCQTAGLNAFIGKRLRESLILVDIVCHGVPSPFIWRDYIKYLERKEKCEISHVDFRDKKIFGWTRHKESYIYTSGKKESRDSFTYLFYQHIMLRHSCSACPFTNLQRPSDITLADLWGWEKVVPDFNLDDKGVSLVLLNTPKGQEIFNKVQKDLFCRLIDIQQCMQPNLLHPSAPNPERMRFEKLYEMKGFKGIGSRYGNWGWKYKMKQHYKTVKQAIKKLIKIK